MYLLSIRPCNVCFSAGHQIGTIWKPGGSLTSSIPVCTEQARARGLAHVRVVTAWSSLISPTPILSPEVWFLSRADIHTNPDLSIWMLRGPGLRHRQHNPPGGFPARGSPHSRCQDLCLEKHRHGGCCAPPSRGSPRVPTHACLRT